MGDLVDELEAAAALVVTARLAPVRKAAATVVDDIHMHILAVPDHHDRDGGGVGGVLDRIGDQFAGEQLGIGGSRVVGEGLADEAAGGRDLLRTPDEGPGLGDASCWNARVVWCARHGGQGS
ncbi:MAG TPA: hypothetical protein VF070_11775 [Streptosporangiaceae bacterium]